MHIGIYHLIVYINLLINFSGWYVTYIDRDPETLAAQERKAKKEKMDKDDEERLMDFIEKQVERAKQDTKEESETSSTPLMRPENDAPLVLDIKLKPKPKLLPVSSLKQEKAKSESISEVKPVSSRLVDEKDKKRKRYGDDKETESTKKIKDDNNPPATEGWLKEGLTVKVTTKSLGNKYYKAKGIVQSIEGDGFVGKVKLKTPEEVSGHVMRLDQEYLETVIPAIGKIVLILWGKHKGKKAIVKKLHIKHYSVDVELEKDKKIIENLPYEQICKYAD